MDDFDFVVSLLTPASDLVSGSAQAEVEGVFGRGGNDVIYAYDPVSGNRGRQNIDVLVGDLFDNSPEEFEVIVGIQEGDPLNILGKDIPSVGKDRFVLGDEIQPYYTSFDSQSLLTTNRFGVNEFALIYDFDPDQDTIQLNGEEEDYVLVELNNLPVDGVEGSFLNGNFFGEAVFSRQQGILDLVAYVLSTPEEDISLDEDYFKFVGNKPDKKPEEKKIGQLGTTGIDLGQAVAADPFGNVFIAGSTTGSLGGSNQGFVDAWVAKYSANGNQTLLNQIGSEASESAYAVVTDEEGNFYLAGSTGGNLFSGKQSESDDAWVAKYSNDGSLLWGEQFNAGGFSNTAFGLDLDEAGNVYVSGLGIKENQDLETFNFSVEDDSWLAKFDSSGNRLSFGDGSSSFDLLEIDTPFFNENYDLAVDNNGNGYLVGWTQGLVEESDPSRNLLKYDAWVSKVDLASGQIEWIQQLGSIDQGLEFGWGVDTDSQGNIYATGWTTGDLGKDPKSKSESYDIWLAKFSPDGSQQWVKQIGSEGDDGTYFSDMEIDAQDNIFLTGYTNDKLGKGSRDKDASNAWVARFDTNGNNEWVQQFGSKDSIDYGTGLSTDGTGKLYVSGVTEAFLGTGTNGSATDAWLAQLDVEKGKLQKFIGDQENFNSIAEPGSVATTDISNTLVTDERLPGGDDKIDVTSGIDTSIGSVDTGQVYTNLTNAVDDNGPNSLPRQIAEAIEQNDGSQIDAELLSIQSEGGSSGEVEDLDLKGTDAADDLSGGAGNDKLEGKDGNDILIGGLGNDELKGGDGIDELIGVDTIAGVSGLGVGEVDELKGDKDGDRFILGNSGQVYYNDGDVTTAGTGDYALIDDFEFDEADSVQLQGQSGDYVLGDSPDGLPKGTAIFLASGQTEPEAIAVFKNIDSDELSLDDQAVFSFV